MRYCINSASLRFIPRDEMAGEGYAAYLGARSKTSDGTSPAVKIAAFNVNGINGRLPILLRWLEEAAPDVVCLQELKAPRQNSRRYDP
jgi:hypothetical protein